MTDDNPPIPLPTAYKPLGELDAVTIESNAARRNAVLEARPGLTEAEATEIANAAFLSGLGYSVAAPCLPIANDIRLEEPS